MSTCGIAILFYCLLVLGFVGTSPDLGLRFLLVDDHEKGPVIRTVTDGLQHKGSERPQPGDVLLAVGPTKIPGRRLQPIGTFVHFTRCLLTLRGETPVGGKLPQGSDPSELGTAIPPLVEIEAEKWVDHKRMVEVEFERPGREGTIKTWLLIHSLPFGEMLLSFVWFLLELGIFSVGALAFWTRPFDRPARLFFAMCIVSVGAFIGGYHWWVIAGSLWLNIPFCVCAVFLPVVTMHFFLIYPHPKHPFVNHPHWTLLALYTAPVVATTGFIGLLSYSSWLYGHDAPQAAAWRALEMLRTWIHI